MSLGVLDPGGAKGRVPRASYKAGAESSFVVVYTIERLLEVVARIIWRRS